MWREIKQLIHQANYFVIATHLNPDGDGIGSATALIELLQALGKKALFLCEGPIPEKFHFLNVHGLHHCYSDKDCLDSFDVLIILDTHRVERLGRVAELLVMPRLASICIDHHLCEKPCTSLAVIDSQACSVGAMIYTLFEECGIEINLIAATGIYSSIISDTGRFSYSSTSRKAHILAEECIKVGVNPSDIYCKLFQQVPLTLIQLFTRILQKMEFHLDNRVVLQQIRFVDYESYCAAEEYGTLQDFDYMHEFNKTIKGIECAAILWELPDGSVRISLRSNSGLDIVKSMKQIGGGGHPNAAGALIPGPFEEAKQTLLHLLRKVYMCPKLSSSVL